MFKNLARFAASSLIGAVTAPGTIHAQAVTADQNGNTVATYFAGGKQTLYEIDYVYPPYPASPSSSWSQDSGANGIPDIADGSPLTNSYQWT